jgi:hypothetical protein
MDREDAVQPGELHRDEHRPVGGDQPDAPASGAESLVGTHQHAEADRVDEAHPVKVEDEAGGTGGYEPRQLDRALRQAADALGQLNR